MLGTKQTTTGNKAHTRTHNPTRDGDLTAAAKATGSPPFSHQQKSQITDSRCVSNMLQQQNKLNSNYHRKQNHSNISFKCNGMFLIAIHLICHIARFVSPFKANQSRIKHFYLNLYDIKEREQGKSQVITFHEILQPAFILHNHFSGIIVLLEDTFSHVHINWCIILVGQDHSVTGGLHSNCRHHFIVSFEVFVVRNVHRLLAELFEAITRNSALCLEGKKSKRF